MARILAVATLALAACELGDQGPPPLSADPGVIFSYPHDGQLDVPLGARVVVSFTDPIDPAALAVGCSLDSAGHVTGGFCVVGPDGPVVDAAIVIGPKDNVVQLEATWAADATYAVYASPDLLWGAAANLRAGEPLLHFTTTQPDAVPGAPVVRAINGDPPAAYQGSGAPRFPFVDFDPIRVSMSEPIDPATATYGDAIALVDEADNKTVPAALLASGTHLTIDPIDDLTAGHQYRLTLSGLRDLRGEAIATTSYTFAPAASRVNGQELAQVLSCVPGGEKSYAAGGVVNRVSVASPLIGDSEIAMQDSTVSAVMANPSAFGPLIPLTLRKGQTLTMQALPVKLGGEIATPLTTGAIRVQMASDATIYLARNPFRDPARLPDDELAPVEAYLAFDVILTADDPRGNAALNQQVLGIQATGLASVYNGGLAIESIGALDLDLLGLDHASSNMLLRLRTIAGDSGPVDTTPPALSVASPADGATGVAVDAPLRITFAEGIDPATAADAVTLSGAPIRVRVDGSTLVVTPLAPLTYGTDYTLALTGVHDLAGVVAPPSSLHFRTQDLTTSAPMPLALAAVRPGVPCALEGATTTSPGRCRSGDGSDDLYAPFTLPADQPVELDFDQPLDRTTIALGAACGAGSVRIERLNGDACASVVPGQLVVGERTLRFVPDAGWEPGARYRVVLHGGNDRDCDAGELCARTRAPLNSDVLDGIADDGNAGGPDVALPFTGAAAEPGRYAMITRTAPVADTNGNGYVDAGEHATATNRAAMVITGTSGMIRSASLRGPDCDPSTPATEACMYLSGALPAVMGSLQHDCEVGGAHVAACIPIELSPQLMYGTSLSLDADVAVVGSLSNQKTEQLVLRLRAPGGAPITGYVVTGADGKAELRARLDLYLDAPSMRLLAGIAGHDLHSKPLAIDVAGPVSFGDDGRITIAVANTAAVPLSVGVSAIGIGIGKISMEIPAGQMKLQLVGEPAKGAR
ncbi:MAG: Ig-like domain-containing protein [Deltaproteobacteria bacterium]|nr:Ig-like domain-containing protein [Deltaproteobacteria bacterium]